MTNNPIPLVEPKTDKGREELLISPPEAPTPRTGEGGTDTLDELLAKPLFRRPSEDEGDIWFPGALLQTCEDLGDCRCNYGDDWCGHPWWRRPNAEDE